MLKPRDRRRPNGLPGQLAEQARLWPFLGLALTIIAAFVLAGVLVREGVGQAPVDPPGNVALVENEANQPVDPAEPEPAEMAGDNQPPDEMETPTPKPEPEAPPTPEPEPEPNPSPTPTDPSPDNSNSQTVNPPEPELETPAPPVIIPTIELPPIASLTSPNDPIDNPGPEPAPSQDPDLGDRLRLSTTARQKYWSHTNPQIVSATTVRQSCQQIEHIVHGCYIRSGQTEQIYIINTTCSGLTESTAVHELLHSAYSHLSSQERQLLRGWLLDFYNANPQLVASLLAPYGPLSLETQINELHSFVGQGIAQLPANLEAHYNQYFSDGRASALAYHQQYQDLTDSHRNNLDEASRKFHQQQQEIDSQRSEISRQRTQIDEDLAWFEAQEARLETLRSSLSDPQANEDYNQLVDEYNQRVDLYRRRTRDYNQLVGGHNQRVDTTRQLVNKHNELVEQANRINRGDCSGLVSI